MPNSLDNTFLYKSILFSLFGRIINLFFSNFIPFLKLLNSNKATFSFSKSIIDLLFFT